MMLQTVRERAKKRFSTQVFVGSSSQQMLLEMIHSSSAEKVADYLTSPEHPDISVVNHVNVLHGLTALHLATRCGEVRVVQVLLKHGALVDAEVRCDNTQAIHIAANYFKETPSLDHSDVENHNKLSSGNGSTNCLQVLIQHGADVNARDKYLNTPLHFASERGHLSAVNILLATRKADLKASNYRSMTPLHEAARHGHHKIVHAILNDNAFSMEVFKAQDENQCTPLMLAAQGGHVETCEVLLKFAETISPKEVMRQLLEQENDQCTPLHAAIESGDRATVRLILETWDKHRHHGDDRILNFSRRKPTYRNTTHLAVSDKYVDMRRSDGNTALHLAADEGNLAMVEMVLQHGASVDALTEEDKTPLHLAALRNRPDIIEVLLASGGSIEIGDEQGCTPLLTACRSGHLEAASCLIQHGAIITTSDKSRQNCLMAAVRSGSFEIVQEILSHDDGKLLVTEWDTNRNTPLHVAAQEGMLSIVKVLLEEDSRLDKRNSNEQTPLHVAALNGQLHVVREIVSIHRSTLHQQDECACTALHLAALHGHASVVSALLDLGANVTHCDVKVQTALDMCVIGGWVEPAVALLQTDGKLVHNKSRSGHTSLLLACELGRHDLVKLLLEHGSDVRERLADGRNALDVAIDNRFEECARRLVEHDTWKDSLRNATRPKDTNEMISTPFRKLVETMPDVAEVVLTKSMLFNEEPLEHVNCEITFDYEIMDDEFEIPFWINPKGKDRKPSLKETTDNGARMQNRAQSLENESYTISDGGIYGFDGTLAPDALPYSRQSMVLTQNHPLKIMIKSKRERLLHHPTVQSWINFKWRKFGRNFYWLNLIAYLIYLVTFNVYMTTTPPRYAVNETHLAEASCVRVLDEAQSVWGDGCIEASGHRHLFTVLVLAISSLQLLKKVTQVFHHRLDFFLDWTNYMEVTLYILSILVFVDFEAHLHNTEIRQRWQWECGAFAVMLSWFNLLLYVRRSKLLGIFVFMIGSVGLTFARFAAIFALFILGFSLSFYVLLQNQIPFNTPGWASVQTFTMMLGEINYPTVFLSHFTSSDYHLIVQYQEATVFIYIVFSVVMNLLLTNLLVGLAVDDISSVQRHASLRRIALKVEGILDINYAVPLLLRRRWMVRERSVLPNKGVGRNPLLSWFFKEENMKAKIIQEAISPTLSEIDKLRAEIKDLKEDMGKLLHAVTQMSDAKQL